MKNAKSLYTSTLHCAIYYRKVRDVVTFGNYDIKKQIYDINKADNQPSPIQMMYKMPHATIIVIVSFPSKAFKLSTQNLHTLTEHIYLSHSAKHPPTFSTGREKMLVEG